LVTPASPSPTVGVIALQGAFARHVEAVRGLGVDAIEVRTPEQLATVERAILPGGESTAMQMLLDHNSLREPLQERIADGMPVFGTCAGMILLATNVVDGRDDQTPLGAIDMTVQRNGYGRQLASFEVDLAIDSVGSEPFPGVFIRAPVVTAVGAHVEVLARHDGHPVLCRGDRVMVASFHPELSTDVRLHELFCSIES